MGGDVGELLQVGVGAGELGAASLEPHPGPLDLPELGGEPLAHDVDVAAERDDLRRAGRVDVPAEVAPGDQPGLLGEGVDRREHRASQTRATAGTPAAKRTETPKPTVRNTRSKAASRASVLSARRWSISSTSSAAASRIRSKVALASGAPSSRSASGSPARTSAITGSATVGVPVVGGGVEGVEPGQQLVVTAQQPAQLRRGVVLQGQVARVGVEERLVLAEREARARRSPG